MGENGLRRHLHAAAAVSLAVLAAACANRQNVAPVMNGLSGAAPEKIEAAPVPPMAPIPRTARPQPPTGPGQRVVVRPGQSVGYLAREYGVTKRAIIEANNLTPPEYKIEIGKTIIIPGGGPGAGEARAPVRAATAEKPPTPPAERPAAARAGKAGEVIPLDEPVPAPKKSAPAPAIGFPPPAAPMKGRLSPPAAEPVATSAPPAGKTVASAEADEPTSPGGHLPWPVRGRVLAGYGSTKEGGQNAGINIAAARGAPVRAVESGTVAYAGNEIRGYGNLVLVKHPNGLISAYAHLDSITVKRGDTVKGGQVIAKVGDTGGVSQPQLHFELRRGKKAVDPREFLGQGSNAGGSKGAEG
jgi:murein DD-endopeptidase MepM/ murein hydrolase activator NlpD